MDKTSFSDSTAQLHEAMRKLEAFSCQLMEDDNRPSVSKTVGLFRALFLDSSLPRKEEKSPSYNQQEMLSTIELINRKRLLIKKLTTGKPDEQRLAHALTKAVDSFNESRTKHLTEKNSQGKSWARFFSRDKPLNSPSLPQIHLSQPMTVTYHYSEHVPPKKEETVSQDAPPSMPSKVGLSKQVAELFQMKVLALLGRYKIASNPEIRDLVKQSPILTSIENEVDSNCILTQTLVLFPGQTVTVKGKSALNPQTQTICQLFPDTFLVSLESTQTGFPAPSQRTGWALVHQLLPEFPQRIDLLEKTALLFQGKKQAVQDLLPQGRLIEKAKQLLKLKKQVFSTHGRELIPMHQHLSEAILAAAPSDMVPDSAQDILSQFYKALLQRPNPYEWLVETHQQLFDLFVVSPHQTLLDAILKGKLTDLGSPEASTRYRAAKAILDQAIRMAQIKASQEISKHSFHEQIKWAYIGCMGTAIGTASTAIILQYLSEDLIFPPPLLTPFEKKLQAMAYLHVEDFLKELTSTLDSETSPQSYVYRLMTEELLADVAIFHENKPLSIPEELALYFQRRYDSLAGDG